MNLSRVLSLLLLPIYAHALVAIGWSVANNPSSGVTDLIFPINMANATHKSGYYYAMQFGWYGASSIGYTGLQPRPDKNGNSVVHAAFSSFVAGTTSDDSDRCKPGADGGEGYSCSVEFQSSYSHTYDILVENTSGTTWVGTAIDTVSGVRTHIGSWTLPAGATGIKSSQVGFIEYYKWNDGKDHPCDTLPWTQVFFGTPTTSTSSATPSLGTPYEYGNCKGKVDFERVKLSDGWLVTVGFHDAGVVDASHGNDQQTVLV